MLYQIIRTSKYKNSLKKISRSGKFSQEELDLVVDILASGEKLSSTYKDHQLKGKLKEFRECHVRGNILLIYKIEHNLLILILSDIGSHSYLFE